MGFRKVALGAAVAMSMASTPVLAQASEASSLSIASAARASAEMDEANGQINQDWIVPGIIIIGVVVVLAFIYLDEDEDSVS